MYEVKATSPTPALILFILDTSGSMATSFGSSTRIKALSDALDVVLQELLARCTTGDLIPERYHIGVIYYNDQVKLLDNIMVISDFVEAGVPEFKPWGGTNTKGAFELAEQLLLQVLPHYKHCPPPLVCHITDGEFTTESPTPVAQRIMNMKNPDGNVLLENVFISEKVLQNPIQDPKSWLGISEMELNTSSKNADGLYARTLMDISSPLPTHFEEAIKKRGYSLQTGRPMMFPAASPELLELALTAAAQTGEVGRPGDAIRSDK